ncbi:unnamed protein product [Musa acuminata subsp. burmannicoides]
MMKATLTGKYETGKDDGKATTTLSINAKFGDASLRATVSDALVLGTAARAPPTLSFSLQKPNSFSIDYSPTKAGTDQKDDLPQAKFKFMNSIKLMEKTLRMTYSHALQERRTEVDGSVEFNEDNKMAVHHVVGTEECKLKYTYQHGERQKTMVEPTYYVAANTWDLVVSRKLDRGEALKASYQAAAKKLQLEWSRDSNVNGTFKISAALNMADHIYPRFVAESTWSYQI